LEDGADAPFDGSRNTRVFLVGAGLSVPLPVGSPVRLATASEGAGGAYEAVPPQALWAAPAAEPEPAAPLNLAILATFQKPPLTQGASVDIGIGASGGVGEKAYQFAVVDGYDPSTIRVVQPYSARNTCRWTPALGGDYTIIGFVADESGKEVWQSIPFRVEPSARLSARLDIAPGDGEGAAETLTARAEGGASTRYYQFVALPSPEEGALGAVVLQPYSLSPTYTGDLDALRASPGAPLIVAVVVADSLGGYASAMGVYY